MLSKNTRTTRPYLLAEVPKRKSMNCVKGIDSSLVNAYPHIEKFGIKFHCGLSAGPCELVTASTGSIHSAADLNVHH